MRGAVGADCHHALVGDQIHGLRRAAGFLPGPERQPKPCRQKGNVQEQRGPSGGVIDADGEIGQAEDEKEHAAGKIDAALLQEPSARWPPRPQHGFTGRQNAR